MKLQTIYVIKNLLIVLTLFVIVGSFFKAISNAATFQISPNSQSFEIGCFRSIDILINATGQSSNAAEVEILYDQTQIDILDSNPSIPGTQIKTGDAFDTYIYNQVNESTGVIKLAATSFLGTLSSQKIFGRIEFSPKPGATSSQFVIRFDGVGVTTDSNIADTSTSTDILTSKVDGNFNYISGPCNADVTPPSVIFQTPTNGQTNVPLNSNVSIRITDNQAGTNLLTVEFLINGETYTVSSPEVTYVGNPLDYTFTINPVNDFPNGSASNINVKVSDNSGNSRFSQIIFNVPIVVPPTPDTQSPVVNFINPTNLETGVPSNENVEINLIDNASGINNSSVEIFINGEKYILTDSEITLSGSSTNLNILIDPRDDFFTDKYNVIQIRGSDNDGNEFDRQIIFNIPEGQIIEPECPVIDDDDEVIPTSSCLGPTVERNEVSQVITDFLGKDSSSQVFKDTVLENTVIDRVTREVGLAGLLSLLTTIILALNFISYLSILNLLGGLIGFIFSKKVRKPWGLIIDAKTGKPIGLALCKLFNSGTQYEIANTFSDFEGKYGFTISPGRYRLEVSQNGYDKFEKEIEVKEDEDSYVFDVELAPKESSLESRTSRVKAIQIKLSSIYKYFFRIFSVLGFIFSIIAMILIPSPLNAIIFTIYITALAVLVLSRLTKRNKYASVVNSSNNLRIPYINVKIYNPKTFELVDTCTTNYDGRFDFFGEPSEYAILIGARGYKFPSVKNKYPVTKNMYNGMIIVELKKGKNNLIIYLDPENSFNPSNYGKIENPFS